MFNLRLIEHNQVTIVAIILLFELELPRIAISFLHSIALQRFCLATDGMIHKNNELILLKYDGILCVLGFQTFNGNRRKQVIHDFIGGDSLTGIYARIPHIYSFGPEFSSCA